MRAAHLLSLSLSLSRAWLGLIAGDQTLKKIHSFSIFYPFSKYRDKCLVIYIVKKLLHITFKRITDYGVILANFAKHTVHNLNSLVVTLSDPTRIRCFNKSWFKYRIQNIKKRMMKNSVSDSGFMNVSALWISYIKSRVFSVFICLIKKFSAKSENILFKISFKFLNIDFRPFALAELLPGQEEVLWAGYFRK